MHMHTSIVLWARLYRKQSVACNILTLHAAIQRCIWGSPPQNAKATGCKRLLEIDWMADCISWAPPGIFWRPRYNPSCSQQLWQLSAEPSLLWPRPPCWCAALRPIVGVAYSIAIAPREIQISTWMIVQHILRASLNTARNKLHSRCNGAERLVHYSNLILKDTTML